MPILIDGDKESGLLELTEPSMLMCRSQWWAVTAVSLKVSLLDEKLPEFEIKINPLGAWYDVTIRGRAVLSAMACSGDFPILVCVPPKHVAEVTMQTRVLAMWPEDQVLMLHWRRLSDDEATWVAED